MVRSKVSVALVGLATMVSLALGQVPASATHGGDSEVTNGSDDAVFSQNKQNEPAVAIDANHPTVLAAGANDNIDLEGCNVTDDTTCPFTPGVGVSGVQFSFNSGDTWSQPEYTGFSARGCLGLPGTPATGDTCSPAESGPIGTLPWYFENGLSSGGDPALAFGPVPGSDGTFAWANGSRLYYANLTANFPGKATFKGAEALAVSRIDGPAATGLTPAIVADKNSWKPPVIVTKQSSTTFSDKEQIWADNAASSPFFGNVYTCLASFRSNSQGNALPTPLIVATSRDGGDIWTQKQVTDATNNPFNPKKGFGRSGCTIRTDRAGVVYVFANQFAVGTPGDGAHILVKSFDGGVSWTRPRNLFQATDTCFFVDPVIGRCMMDGVAGARDDLSSSPSVDISNGAPLGGGTAPNVIYDAWVDGRTGSAGPPVDNTTQVRLAFSVNSGATWTQTVVPTAAGDRPYYAAVALSPDGTDAYLVYNAFTTPFRDNTSDLRNLVGVVMHSDVNPVTGVPAGFSEIHRGADGDPRGSAQNNLVAEFLGDYVYAAATNTYGAAVWNDTRNAADCPAMDAWRAFLRGGPSAPKPAPQQDCVPDVTLDGTKVFGNSDIFGGSFADPS